MSGVEQLVATLVIGGVVVILLGAITVTAAATVLTRRVRLRWRSVRSSYPTDRAALTSAAVAGAAHLASPRWWTIQAARHQMWQSVRAARKSVDLAQRTGAPVGEFPALARRLEASARHADSLAKAATSTGTGVHRAVSQLRRIDDAATDLHNAAVESLESVVGTSVDPTISSLRQEIAAVAAGTRAHRDVHRRTA